nr:LuxR C-terminal-related transcriptional regulator [Saprospiraceae bacterium]
KQHIQKELRSTKVKLIKKIKEDHEKGKLLKSLNEKLSLLKSSNANNTKVKELLKIIERSKNDKNDSFQIHIDELNQNYIHNLKAIFPSLSMYDLRLCTYIKTGLSTREIADIMNVLPSSINVSRSRLRKKLNLESNDDLFSFLDSLKDEE